MGLDMYFSAKIRLHTWNDAHVENANKVLDIFPYIDKETIDTVNVTVTVGYWRKANAIHNWFVKNVQNNVDECQEFYVTVADITNLLEVVDKVSTDNTLANTLLPSGSGFFFGSTDYDNWYISSLENTKKIMENALNMARSNNDISFYYQSSW